MLPGRRRGTKYILVLLVGITIYNILMQLNECCSNSNEALEVLPRRAGKDVVNTDDVDSACTRHFDNETVHVVIMADKPEFTGMLTLANSIFRNTRSDVMFHFVTFPSDVSFLKEWLNTGELRDLSHEIIPFSKVKLEGKFKVRSPRKDLANVLNFARIYLPDLLPCVSRVIFIDADCLVLGDISELYHTNIAPKDVIAGFNQCDVMKGSFIDLVMDYKNRHVQEAGIPKKVCMMNGGVFVADLVKWEQQHVSQDLQYWMELNNRESVFKNGVHGSGTQALIMAVLHSKYTSIPKQWNTLSQLHSTAKHAKLIHWNGENKPWTWKGRGTFSQQWTKYCVPAPKQIYQHMDCLQEEEMPNTDLKQPVPKLELKLPS